jgi:hypothetical protein
MELWLLPDMFQMICDHSFRILMLSFGVQIDLIEFRFEPQPIGFDQTH